MSGQTPEIVTEVITLADVRSDVRELAAQVGQLSSDVRAQTAQTTQRLNTLEDRDHDKETRLRVIEQTGATRSELDKVRAQIDARQEAARGRIPAWGSVLIGVMSLLITVGAVVAGIAVAVAQ